MDMIERKKFQDYQNIETLVNEGLHIAMSHVLADDSLDVILSYLGKILKADRVYIFEKNARGNDDNTYEWAREGVSEEKAREAMRLASHKLPVKCKFAIKGQEVKGGEA